MKLNKYLDIVDIDKLIEDGKEFLKINYEECDDDYILEEFESVMQIENITVELMPTYSLISQIPLFRTRIFKESSFPIDLIEGTFREPPAEKYNHNNRFDIVPRPVLYMSLGDGITYLETSIEDGNYYALSVFVNICIISVKGIGPMFDSYILRFVNLNEDQLEKYKIIMDFVAKVLMISSYKDKTNHRISKLILCRIINEIPDCFFFPSRYDITECKQYNFACFRPEAFRLYYSTIRQWNTEKIIGALPAGNNDVIVNREIQPLCVARQENVIKWYQNIGAINYDKDNINRLINN